MVTVRPGASHNVVAWRQAGSPAATRPGPDPAPPGPPRACPRAAQLIVELITIGLPLPRKKMPGKPAVWKPAFGLRCSLEFLIVSVPVLSLLTKKIAPPPSLAWLSRMR